MNPVAEGVGHGHQQMLMGAAKRPGAILATEVKPPMVVQLRAARSRLAFQWMPEATDSGTSG